MFTHTPPLAGYLLIKTLVARQQPTNIVGSSNVQLVPLVKIKMNKMFIGASLSEPHLDKLILYFIIGASQNEPHTSDVN